MTEPQTPSNTRHRLVIVGGGFGGLETVHNLRNADIDITLIDQRNHHLFQPLLYQVATSTLATSEIAWPIRHLLRKYKNVKTLLGTVEASIPPPGPFQRRMARPFPTTRWCWRPAHAMPISAMTIGSRSRPA